MSRAGRGALLVSGLVLAGLIVSLAPSVTFWDAGEFIAAMKILGIPHPPGTPLFVMMGHVFGSLVPVGEFAFRTNLMTALFAAGAAGFWFLVLLEIRAAPAADSGGSPAGGTGPAWAAAGAGAVIAAFTFSNWLNSNETEVYSVATFTIAAAAWLMLRWRRSRGTPASRRYLLLAGFLLGIAVGNHLLGLLAGPAILAFMVAVLRESPRPDLAARRQEWSEAAVMAAAWVLLVGIGLGSPVLAGAGTVLVLGAIGLAVRQRDAGFAILFLAVALVGITPYLFLYLRAAHNPIINEADPSTWESLLAVMRRAQYGIRTPFDDPTFRHEDPANPGRGLRIIAIQLANYVQYFDWQWANAVPFRMVFTAGFLVLGAAGLRSQWRADRPGAVLLLTLFLVTGLGLVAYMNFKPGYSIGYNWFPDPAQHEVRERDYFFVVSFVVFGLWAGRGLGVLAAGLAARWARAAVYSAALVPFLLNFPTANRRFGPEARLPADFAWNLLNSVPPYGILFTYGDNDTFPLWWAQEVEGIRRDVTVVCLALAETDWYMRQLRHPPVRPFEPALAPPAWRDHPVRPPDRPLHTMTDEEIGAAVPRILSQDVTLPVGNHRITLPAQTVLYGKDFLAIRIIQQNFGRRPIVWALTAAGNYYRLDQFVVQRGLGIQLETEPVDTTLPSYHLGRLMGVPLDVPRTEHLMEETYRYAGMLEREPGRLENTAAGIASTIGLPYTQLTLAAEARGDSARVLRFLERAIRITPNPALLARLRELQARLPSAAR